MTDQQPVDPLPALKAELDQALAQVGEVARACRGLYNAYRKEGFSDKQALFLAACQFNPPQAPGE